MEENARRDTRLIVGLALLAPIIFVIHVIEEAPTFVSWFNSLVEPDITVVDYGSVRGALQEVPPPRLGHRRDRPNPTALTSTLSGSLGGEPISLQSPVIRGGQS
jgi:hypothetical protein